MEIGITLRGTISGTIEITEALIRSILQFIKNIRYMGTISISTTVL